MISIPDAWQLPRIAGRPPSAISASGQRGRKTGLCFRKMPPRLQRRRASDFPVAGGRILARRALDPKTPQRAGLFLGEARRQNAGRGLGGKTKTEGVEMGQAQRASAQALPVA